VSHSSSTQESTGCILSGTAQKAESSCIWPKNPKHAPVMCNQSVELFEVYSIEFFGCGSPMSRAGSLPGVQALS